MPRMRAKVLQRQTSFPLQQDAGLAYLPTDTASDPDHVEQYTQGTPEIESFSSAADRN